MNGRLRNKTLERRAFVVFMISLGLTLAALFGGIFIGVNVRNVQMVKDGVLERGRALFRQIVLTRRWAAGYGGVYVPKKPGVVSNPWLDHPDLLAADGSTLTLRNPALMTREISEIAAQSEGYRFRITSLKPLNPANSADPFEQDALLAFEAGVRERWATVTGSGGKEFRYMGVLLAEPSCMICHAAQGYRVGVWGRDLGSFPCGRCRGSDQTRHDRHWAGRLSGPRADDGAGMAVRGPFEAET